MQRNINRQYPSITTFSDFLRKEGKITFFKISPVSTQRFSGFYVYTNISNRSIVAQKTELKTERTGQIRTNLQPIVT
jgi:hypothetical protein